jgi:hypothetical protein
VDWPAQHPVTIFVQKNAEKSLIFSAHLPELATALYEAFALHAPAVRQCRDTSIRCAPLPTPAQCAVRAARDSRPILAQRSALRAVCHRQVHCCCRTCCIVSALKLLFALSGASAGGS